MFFVKGGGVSSSSHCYHCRSPVSIDSMAVSQKDLKLLEVLTLKYKMYQMMGNLNKIFQDLQGAGESEAENDAPGAMGGRTGKQASKTD